MFNLLKTQRFLPFYITQFLGAFNDNLFKNALVVLLTFKANSITNINPVILASIAPAIFLLPFFLLSAIAGQYADKYNKDMIAQKVKFFEIIIMALVGVGFYFNNIYILLTCLFLFGIHSAFFGPVKYAILPQHLNEKELVAGNALIESGTFIAILLGTLLGAYLASLNNGEVYITISGLLIAILGYISSKKIPVAQSSNQDLKINFNFVKETINTIKISKSNSQVYFSIITISWFWLIGIVFLSQFPIYTKEILKGNESIITLLLAIFTIGIGFGSYLCEKLSHQKINLNLVMIGSLGISIGILDFSFASNTLLKINENFNETYTIKDILSNFKDIRILIDLMIIGIFGGFYCVPLYTLMQTKSDEKNRARIIASNNIMNALFMVLSSIIMWVMIHFGLSLIHMFSIFGIFNLIFYQYIKLNINKIEIIN